MTRTICIPCLNENHFFDEFIVKSYGEPCEKCQYCGRMIHQNLRVSIIREHSEDEVEEEPITDCDECPHSYMHLDCKLMCFFDDNIEKYFEKVKENKMGEYIDVSDRKEKKPHWCLLDSIITNRHSKLKER